MLKLTAKQRELLNYLAGQKERGRNPSVTEAAEALNVTPSLLHRRMKSLQEKRYIHRRYGSRQFTIIRE